MSRSRLLVPLVAVLIGLGFVPSPVEAAQPSALRAGPGYHEPVVGSCYALSSKQAFKPSSTKAAVPCDSPHTMYTVKVKRLSGSVPWKDGAKLYATFAVTCQKAVKEALGGNSKLWAMSAYDLFWFIPTKDERANGAKWVRCDVGLHAGAGKIAPIPASLALSGLPLPNNVAYCLAGNRLNDTACNKPHRYKAKGVVKLSSPVGATGARRIAGNNCPRITGARQYAYHWPSTSEFKAGQHWLVCFKPD